MRSSTTSHKNQFFRILDNKNNCYRELKIETFIEQNPRTQWEITKGINQKGLAFHAEAKQKNYKEEKKLRNSKPYEAPLFLLDACVLLQAFLLQGSWENIVVYIFVNIFQVSIFLEFLYFVENLLPILFLRYCRFYFLFLLLDICFLCWFQKQLRLLHI